MLGLTFVGSDLHKGEKLPQYGPRSMQKFLHLDQTSRYYNYYSNY